jgi:hypothetical protein
MNLKVEYLGEIEVIFEMALGNKSGDQVGSIHEKKPKVENLVRLSLFKGTVLKDIGLSFKASTLQSTLSVGLLHGLLCT